jgi:hypothetical protein
MKPVKGGQGPVWAVVPLIIISVVKNVIFCAYFLHLFLFLVDFSADPFISVSVKNNIYAYHLIAMGIIILLQTFLIQSMTVSNLSCWAN